MAAAMPNAISPTPAAAMNPRGSQAGGTFSVGFMAAIAAGLKGTADADDAPGATDAPGTATFAAAPGVEGPEE